MEQLLGLPFEIWDDNKGKFVEDSNHGDFYSHVKNTLELLNNIHHYFQ